MKGEVPTAALAAESGRIPMNKYGRFTLVCLDFSKFCQILISFCNFFLENVGYINGQVQSEGNKIFI